MYLICNHYKECKSKTCGYMVGGPHKFDDYELEYGCMPCEYDETRKLILFSMFQWKMYKASLKNSIDI